MLTFTSDSKPLDMDEESDGITFSTMACDGVYATNETSIVVGPVCRSVTTENGQILSHPGKHTYRLLLVEVAE